VQPSFYPVYNALTTNQSEMCSASEAGSYLRLIDFVYHSTLGYAGEGRAADGDAGHEARVRGLPVQTSF